MPALLLAIEGRVQGVGYRDWMCREAAALGLDGWVRNRPDGSVQALVSGEGAALRALVAAARRGPAAARVATIGETPADAPAEQGFRRLPTG
jgi:acylphosphatase